MTARDTTDGGWRDEKRLPLAELAKAVAFSANEGQLDDLTGNDAGMEMALGEPLSPDPEEDGDTDGDPDPTSMSSRALRTDFTGRVGPH